MRRHLHNTGLTGVEIGTISLPKSSPDDPGKKTLHLYVHKNEGVI